MCGVEKDESEFSMKITRLQIRQSRCKACRLILDKEWRAESFEKDPEKWRAKWRAQWHKRNTTPAVPGEHTKGNLDE